MRFSLNTNKVVKLERWMLLDEQFDLMLFLCRFKMPDQTVTSAFCVSVTGTLFPSIFEIEQIDTGESPVFTGSAGFTPHFWMSDLTVVQESHQESLSLPFQFGTFLNSISNVRISISPCLGCEELHFSFFEAGSLGRDRQPLCFQLAIFKLQSGERG